VLLVVLTLSAAGGTWLLYGSSWLRVAQVEVTGTRVLTPDRVRPVASVPLGGPLISVDTDGVARRLRATLPRIASVSVERSWPHTIALKVTERTPAVITERSGKFTEVDAGGVQYATSATAPKGVPLVKLTLDQSTSRRYLDTKRLLEAAIAVAGDLPAVVRGQARVIQVRSYDSITVELSGGRSVMWGSDEQGPEKAVAVTALVKAAKGAVHFDVSTPTAPAASAG
jgi:cell division protein FtsQ